MPISTHTDPRRPIIIIQLVPLTGNANPPGGPLAALGALPVAVMHLQVDALAIGLIALLIGVFLPARIGRIVPSPLVALAVGMILGRTILAEEPILGDIPTGFPAPQLPVFDLQALPGMIKSALVLAVLGSIDSLLTSLIADNITHTQHDSDRELIGQGIGNTIAGIMGAIPGAGATMRTVVNVRAGGRTPVSGMVHALILLAVMMGLGGFAAYIPNAVLAGILIKVGIDIIDWDYLKKVRHAPRAGVTFMFTVLLLTVFVDLITAVAVGVVLASLLFVKRMSDLQSNSIKTISEETEETPLNAAEAALLSASQGQIVLVHISGPLSFGAANELVRRLLAGETSQVLILDLSDVPFIDSSASLALDNAIQRARGLGREVLLSGLRKSVETTLDKLGVLRKLGDKARFNNRLEALREASNELTKNNL